jgi:formate dehydrogenase
MNVLTPEKQLVQLRYAEGVKDMLNRYFKGEDFPVQNYIVKEGQLASQYQ